MKISKGTYWIIDFDSTFVKVECMPELARIALVNNPDREKIIGEITQITDMGMNGEISFRDSLTRRLQLLSAHKSTITDLVKVLQDRVSLSILRNKDFFAEHSESIYIITGGFREFVVPIVSEYGLDEKHVLANSFIYDYKSNIIGFDKSNPLADAYGKAKVVEKLNLGKDVYIIGDGMTDYEVKEKGCASKFIAFVENIARPTVLARADFVAHSFDEIISMYAS